MCNLLSTAGKKRMPFTNLQTRNAFRGGPALLLLLTGQALAAPGGGEITFGDGNISQAGALTSIDQSSDRLAIEWQSFSIGEGEQVSFSQPGANAIALNQDLSGNLSEILGDLNANGQVFLINPAGVLIGASASIDTAGLLISDHQLSNDDLSADSLLLEASGGDTSGIENRGTITTGAGGAHFVGSRVINSGSIETTGGGHISFTFADSARYALSGQSEAPVGALSPLGDAEENLEVLLDNTSSGRIVSLGGNVYVTASYYQDLNLSASRNEGTINALVINGEGGRIFLADNAESRPFDNSVGEQVLSDQDTAPAVESSGAPDFTGSSLDAVITLDDLVSDCNPADAANGTDCEKENAIKRYLGRMLVNGRLPR
jgi:filamentous hemagglutinin family protein